MRCGATYLDVCCRLARCNVLVHVQPDETFRVRLVSCWLILRSKPFCGTQMFTSRAASQGSDKQSEFDLSRSSFCVILVSSSICSTFFFLHFSVFLPRECSVVIQFSTRRRARNSLAAFRAVICALFLSHLLGSCFVFSCFVGSFLSFVFLHLYLFFHFVFRNFQCTIAMNLGNSSTRLF